jgi:predicted dehydrogenase
MQLLASPFLSDAPFPELTRRLRLGIVGAGRIARVHRWAAALSERWDVAASSARQYGRLGANPVALAQAGLRTGDGERLYADFSDMARQEARRVDRVDAVAICLPNHLHFAASKCFLEEGIAVLCEKPLVTCPHEGAELIRIAEVNGCVTATSYPYASYPMVRQAKHLVDAGLIGPIQQIYAEFTQDFLLNPPQAGSSPEWRLDRSISGAGSTADIGTHALQMLESVSGLRVETICARLTSCGPSKALDDTFHVLLRCNDDVPGVLIGSQVAAGMTTGPQFRLHGENGTLIWSNASPQELTCHLLHEPTRTYSRGIGRGNCLAAERLSRRGRGNVEGWLEAFSNLYVEFSLAIAARHDASPIPSGSLELPDFADGLRGTRFVQAAVRSSELNGQWIAV